MHKYFSVLLQGSSAPEAARKNICAFGVGRAQIEKKCGTIKLRVRFKTI
jgi:hypothetical protein